MNFKTLVLGSAAALMTVAGAQAADLPAEPVDYVRVCDAYGSGFYYLPGTDTCLKVGGRVRADFAYTHTDSSAAGPNTDEDNTEFQTRAYIRLDARTQTDYGLLRTYINVFSQFNESATGAARVDDAFVQWGGLSAGQFGVSFFTTQWYGGYDYFSQVGVPSADPRVMALAYTFDIGNGVSATVALEDRGLVSTEDGSRAGASLVTGLGPRDLNNDNDDVPSIVGQIRINQGWGKADLSVVASYNEDDTNPNFDNGWGYGVQLGAEFNIPVAGANDTLGVVVAYFDSTTAYAPARDYVGIPGLVAGADNEIDFEDFHVAVGFSHFFSPEVSFSLTGSYDSVEFGSGVTVADFDAYSVAGNINWTPVSGLLIGGEIAYNNVDIDGGAEVDTWSGIFRIQRTF